ncbi:MAG: hypothetical protein WAO76_10720 [Georgfuchsia sp.]
MSESAEKKSGGIWGHLISEIVAFIPKDLRELIGFMAGMYLLVFLPIIIISGVSAIKKSLDKPETQTAQCWQIQKIDSRFFKLNSCTGEALEITPTPNSPSQTPVKKK